MAYAYGAPAGFGGPQQGYDYNNAQQNGAAPGGYGQHFQAQAMPGFDNPVIRMGMDNRRGQGGDAEGRGGRYDNRRAGLGADHGGSRNLDRDRQQIRDSMQANQPPTREEVARTIFIGGIGDSAPPDEAIDAILRSAGKLRRWTRALDANDKKCRFGFAEYEDVDSLETAKELFGEGLEVPEYKDGKVVVTGEDATPQMIKLLVVVDEQSSKYIDEWMSKRQDAEEAKQFRVAGAREDLEQTMARLVNAAAFGANGALGEDTVMDEAANPEAVEVPVSGEDELSDIPAEQRATVAQEIKNFRDRSNFREQELLKQEEELEAKSRPANRLASPGPATNGARSGVSGAPSGPKSYRGAQLPSDYVNGVAFVSADTPEDDSDASDMELENRRKTAKAKEDEQQYQEAERRWLARERQRLAASERERTREEAETRDRERQKAAMAKRLSNWDDEEEERIGKEEYYFDRQSWSRKRAAQRDREAREDDRDRQLEAREKQEAQRREDESRGAADRFLAETGAELAAAKQPAFKISMGAAGRNKSSAQPRRDVQDFAGLLEDEEDAAETGQRRLRTMPLLEPTANPGTDMTEEERTAARQALATEIPMDAKSLFAWEVRWSYIRPELLEREIRPFVEKKVVEYLGVQEDFLVDIVITSLKEQKPPEQMIAQLAKVLDDDAEGLVKKVWRLVVYFGEAEGRGLVV